MRTLQISICLLIALFAIVIIVIGPLTGAPLERPAFGTFYAETPKTKRWKRRKVGFQ